MGAQLVLSSTDLNSIQHKQSDNSSVPGSRRQLQPQQPWVTWAAFAKQLDCAEELCWSRLSTTLLLAKVRQGCGFISAWKGSVNDLKVQSSGVVWKNTRRAAMPAEEPSGLVGCLWVFLAFHLLTEVRKTQRRIWKNTFRRFRTWKPVS